MNIVILGGGPAGVGAAWKLSRERDVNVVLVERNEKLGGCAGSFEHKGHILDFGSHRLHPATAPEILDDVRSLLGDDLLDRPRHGRIRLGKGWLHFPLKPVDLLRHAGPRFLARIGRDVVTKPFRRSPAPGAAETFASVLARNLGPTICEDFYFPYARKIWGLPPEQLSAEQARRRVAAGSISKLVRKVLSAVPGLKPPGAGRFFYPRGGFGSITEAYARAARKAGAEIRTSSEVVALRPEGRGFVVTVESPSGREEIPADAVWSTIPAAVLVRLLPDTPAEVLEAASRMRLRAMTLAYVELTVDRFTEYDAHYFPGADLRMTRLSEPKNYGCRSKPAGRTVLCAEFPCTVGDEVWQASDEELGRWVANDLARVGLSLDGKVSDVWSARLPAAYPIYEDGFEDNVDRVDAHLLGKDGILSFGRQGLFAHDNTHHTLAMAYAAVDCLENGSFDHARWEDYRREFAGHVVED